VPHSLNTPRRSRYPIVQFLKFGWWKTDPS
jgi:hypothetical protein